MRKTTDYFNESADKLRPNLPESEQPEWVSPQEKLTHDAHKERWVEKAYKQFEHQETTETTKSELEAFKKSHHNTVISSEAEKSHHIRTENISPSALRYETAQKGRKVAIQKVETDIQAMHQFFTR